MLRPNKRKHTHKYSRTYMCLHLPAISAFRRCATIFLSRCVRFRTLSHISTFQPASKQQIQLVQALVHFCLRSPPPSVALSLSLSRYVAHPALLSAFTSDLKRAGSAVHSLATRSIIAHSPACHILTYISTCIYIFLFVCLFIRVVSFICSLAQSFRYFY